MPKKPTFGAMIDGFDCRQLCCCNIEAWMIDHLSDVLLVIQDRSFSDITTTTEPKWQRPNKSMAYLLNTIPDRT